MKTLPGRAAVSAWTKAVLAALARVTSLLTQAQIPVSNGPNSPLATGTTTNYFIAQRGPHQRIWERVTLFTNAANHVAAKTNSYAELATGIGHLDASCQWADSSDQITPTATGAQATNAQHSLAFAGQIGSAGAAINLVTPDAKTLASHVLGLSYFDTSSGKAVWIAEVTNSVGELLPSGNEVGYPGAFSGLDADLYYVNSISSLEQFVVLRQQPPSPSEWGLDPASTMLQVITEFDTAPVPQVATTQVGSDTDDCLDFGVMKMGPGTAFALGSETNKIRVNKHWVLLDSKTCLVEEVPFQSVQAQLQDLPASPPASADLPASPDALVRRMALRQAAPPTWRAGTAIPMRMAAARPLRKGFLMDYIILTTQTNLTLQSDSTYYVSGKIYLYGSNNVAEGGTVLKFATNGSINLIPGYGTPNLTFSGKMYRPIVCTAVDDQSVGEQISGSGPAPSGYYANPAFNFAGISPAVPVLSNLRISYASIGVSLGGVSADISHAQFVNCQNGLSVGGGTVHLRNALFYNVPTNIVAGGGLTLAAENVTFSGSSYLASAPSAPTGCSLAATNCVFVNVTNLTAGILSLSGDYNGFFQTTSFGTDVAPTPGSSPLQTVGGGTAYLAANSGFRGAGTRNINSSLLSDLGRRTTYPPVVYSSSGVLYLFTNTVLYPQAQRDTCMPPDLGYSYDPIDFAFPYVYVTNASITVTPGTVITAYHGTYPGGLAISTSAQLLCQGSATNLVQFTEFAAVQEQGSSSWNGGIYSFILANWQSGSVPTAINCRFTDFSSLAQDTLHLGWGGGTTLPINFQNCQFHGGLIQNEPTSVNLTNCLLERVNLDLEAQDSYVPVMRNNLFYGGTLVFTPWYTTNGVVKDNLFDRTSLPYDTGGYIGGFNAFVTNCDRLTPTNSTDIVLPASPAYQAGPLGNYYQLTNSALVNADTNTTADQVGLYHYTMYTNLVNGWEIKETNSFLDVGLHFVAVDTNGCPIDTDGGGAPDYIENAAGDGATNNVNETNWQNPSDDFNYLLVPQYLRCEYRQNPWGITTNYGLPRLYWIVTSSHRAEKQVSYRVLVAASTNNLNANYGDMWDSGEVYSDQTIHVQYNGYPFASGQRLWWKVRTRDLYTGLSTWSTNGFFQIGLLSADDADWAGAAWLGVTPYSPNHDYPCPMFRSTNIVLTKPITSATAYISAKGVYELWINGYRVGSNICFYGDHSG